MDARVSQHHLSVREQLVLSFLWFGLNIQSAALFPIVIPTQILLFVAPGQVGNAEQATFLGWLSAMGAVFSLVVPPIIGLLSDRTGGPFGRRRPYIAVGGALAVLSALLLAGAASAALLVLGLAIFQLATNAVNAAYQGLLPDIVPEDQRGAASGYMGLMTILGNVGSLALAAWLLGQVNFSATSAPLIARGASMFYMITDVVLGVGILVTIAWVHEIPYRPLPRTQPQAAALRRLRRWFSANWIAPWRSYNFTVVFLTRFCVMMGLDFFLTFIEYYFANVVHVSNFVQQTAAVATLALVGAMVSTLTLGIFSDRVRRAPLVCLSTLFMGLAALVFVVAPTALPLWPLGLLFGLGYGAYTSVDWALAIDALPSREMVARDLGLWSASSTLPSTLAPLLGSVVISVAGSQNETAPGYRLVFALATVFLLLGAVFVLKVRESRNETPTASSSAPSSTTEPARRHVSTQATEDGQRAQRVHPLWRLALGTHAGQARGIMRFWTFWEGLTRFLLGIQPVPDAPYGLFHARLTRYHRRRDLTLADGTTLQHGARILELHFNNQALSAAALQQTPWRLLQMMGADLRALATWLQAPELADVQAIYGVTLLSRAAPRLGFTVRARPRSLGTWADKIFMTGLLLLYHPRGQERLLQGTTYGSSPCEAWMSRQELLRRYGRSPDS
jgi:MFS family permease